MEESHQWVERLCLKSQSSITFYLLINSLESKGTIEENGEYCSASSTVRGLRDGACRHPFIS